jgi:hypothetical protein
MLTWLTHDLSALQLERALIALRLPAAFVALVMETHAFAGQLLETLQAAWAACALRGGLSSLAALRHTVGGVAGVVILRSIDRSERVAVASALRGLGATLGDDDAETLRDVEPRAVRAAELALRDAGAAGSLAVRDVEPRAVHEAQLALRDAGAAGSLVDDEAGLVEYEPRAKLS